MHGHIDRGRFTRRISALCDLLGHFRPLHPGKIGPFCFFLFRPFHFRCPVVSLPFFFGGGPLILLHAARPRLMPVCPLEIDCMASLFLVVATRRDVCCEQGSAQARSGLLCPQSSAQSKEAPVCRLAASYHQTLLSLFQPSISKPPGGG